MSNLPEKHFTGYLQSWTESERGWGRRPDGHTLYATLEARTAHLKNDNDAKGGSVPDVYSFPDGDPKLVRITEDAANRIGASTNGWIWAHIKDIIL